MIVVVLIWVWYSTVVWDAFGCECFTCLLDACCFRFTFLLFVVLALASLVVLCLCFVGLIVLY